MKRLMEILKIKAKQGFKQSLKIPSSARGKKAGPCICGIFCEIERLKGDVTVIIIL